MTHSPNIAVEAAACASVEIVVRGGWLFRYSVVNVGASVIDAASQFRADLYFMGVTGLHLQVGLTTAT